MTRLVALAVWLCGESAGRHVFEPLVADWQREWLDAAHTSRAHRAAIIARGAVAFTATLLLCSVRHALDMEVRMWGIGAFALAVLLATIAEAALIGASTPLNYPADVLLLAAVRLGAAAALAPAMLPALFLLRRSSRENVGTAIGAIACGCVITAIGVVAQPWLADWQPTAAQNERMFQRTLADDRAGKLKYPGTVWRDGEAESTFEQRQARYEEFQKRRAQEKAKQPAGPTAWQRLQRSTLPLLAALFGMVGWSLGALTRPTVTRAAVWWSVAWLAALVAAGRLPDMFGLPGVHLSWWSFPAALAITAAILMLASARRSPDRSTDHPITSS